MPTPDPDQELPILDGYQLIRFLGQGGFGQVWLCRSLALGDFRALKWIPSSHGSRLEKEYQSLVQYRRAAAALRSPHLISIDHVGRNDDGLYYIMPLADGLDPALGPVDPAWRPHSLAEAIDQRRHQPTWFSSQEITDIFSPILDGLQALSNAGLVHRDVKPDNILFVNGTPCLADIGLVGMDAAEITRHGTPGYITPSWYQGGNPDMYAAAATLYTLLTGNAPDKLGRSAFLWPPQGDAALSASERLEWRRIHAVIRRATHEQVSERFQDLDAMNRSLCRGNADSSNKANRPGKSRKLGPALLSVIGGCLAAGAGLAAFLRGQKAPEPLPLPAPENQKSETSGATAAPIAAPIAPTTPPTIAPPPNPPTAPAPAAQPTEHQLTADQTADYAALAALVVGFSEDGNFANALAAVDELLAKYPQARTQPAYSVARAQALLALGRSDEAKQELQREVNLSPQIAAMVERKKLWEQLGDLPAAEANLTQIIDLHGPATIPLHLRADLRAQQGNYSGAETDRQQALTLNGGGPDQAKLVASMWGQLERANPRYALFLGQSSTTSPDVPTSNQAGKSELTAPVLAIPLPQRAAIQRAPHSLTSNDPERDRIQDNQLVLNTLKAYQEIPNFLTAKERTTLEDTLIKVEEYFESEDPSTRQMATGPIVHLQSSVPELTSSINLQLAMLLVFRDWPAMIEPGPGQSGWADSAPKKAADRWLQDPNFVPSLLPDGPDALGYRFELLRRMEVVSDEPLNRIIDDPRSTQSQIIEALLERCRNHLTRNDQAAALADAQAARQLATKNPQLQMEGWINDEIAQIRETVPNAKDALGSLEE